MYGLSYDMWHRKTYYLLKEQEVLEPLTNRWETQTAYHEKWLLHVLYDFKSMRNYCWLVEVHHRVDSYNMNSKYSMAEHVRKMPVMIRELEFLLLLLVTDKWTVLWIPQSWYIMKFTVMHNENITTFLCYCFILSLKKMKRI